MGLFSKKQPALTDELIAVDVSSRGGKEEDIRAALGLPPKKPQVSDMPYRLYRDETACDSDDFGPPRGEYLTLALAMVATGLPVSAWRSDPHCPDEIFSTKDDGEVDWQIIAPGAAAEFAALIAA